VLAVNFGTQPWYAQTTPLLRVEAERNLKEDMRLKTCNCKILPSDKVDVNYIATFLGYIDLSSPALKNGYTLRKVDIAV